MAIEDAGALASALAAHPGDISTALTTFERKRTAETAREVLFSRHLGRVKQMLDPAAGPSDPEDPTANPKSSAASETAAGGRTGSGQGWASASEAERRALGQANMATFPVPPQLQGRREL